MNKSVSYKFFLSFIILFVLNLNNAYSQNSIKLKFGLDLSSSKFEFDRFDFTYKNKYFLTPNPIYGIAYEDYISNRFSISYFFFYSPKKIPIEVIHFFTPALRHDEPLVLHLHSFTLSFSGKYHLNKWVDLGIGSNIGTIRKTTIDWRFDESTKGYFEANQFGLMIFSEFLYKRFSLELSLMHQQNISLGSSAISLSSSSTSIGISSNYLLIRFNDK